MALTTATTMRGIRPLRRRNCKIPKYHFLIPKCQFDTLEHQCKSLSTVKRLMKSLQDKNYIRRESGKRYGKWEVLI